MYGDVLYKARMKIFGGDIVVTMITTGNWRPYGITFSATGDLLVCLRKDDQSKLVRCSSTGTVLQEIQYDSHSQPLFQWVFYISKNVKGDIIVTDFLEKKVVTVDRLGIFRNFYFLRYLISEGGIKLSRAVCMVGDGEMIVGETLTGLAKAIKFIEEQS